MKANKLITWLLTLIGFGAAMAGCDGNGNPVPDAYGSPYAKFEVKGQVSDDSGDPIRDVKIVMKEEANSEWELGVGITDAWGNYAIEAGDGGRRRSVVVIAEDIDGDKNGGEFAMQTKVIEFADSDYVGGDGWYAGKAEKTASFVLELKPQENENE